MPRLYNCSALFSVFSLSFSFFYHISFCLTSATAVVIFSFYYFLFVRQVLLLLLQLLLLLLFCQAPDTTKCKTQKNAKRDLPTHHTHMFSFFTAFLSLSSLVSHVQLYLYLCLQPRICSHIFPAALQLLTFRLGSRCAALSTVINNLRKHHEYL